MDYRSIYETARAAWTWGNDTPSDNEQFYRDYAAGLAVWRAWMASKGIDAQTPNCLIHQCSCTSSHEAGFDRFVRSLRGWQNTRHVTKPRPERPIVWHDSEPILGEHDARKLFEVEFRATYKGKRLNSAFANAEWERLKTKAQEIVESRHARVHAEWKAREDRRRHEHAEKLSAWMREEEGRKLLLQFIDDVCAPSLVTA